MVDLRLPDLKAEVLSAKAIERCGDLVSREYGYMPKAFVHAFGCQQNVADTEALSGLLQKVGFDFCKSEAEADLVLYNTCAVRETAEEKVFGHIGRLKQLKTQNPKFITVVCGCMTQRAEVRERLKKSYSHVDVVFGAGAMHRLPELLAERIAEKRQIYFSQQAPNVVEDIPTIRGEGVRAWLPIMQGCDNFCSFCIVPYVRGREVSRPAEKIIEEAKEILSQGYKEIILLGQNVNSYGKKTKDIDFADLVYQLDQIEGEHWFRFMTSHPRDCTEKLLDTISTSKHFCKHIHLPVQSGSDRVLKVMNRHYDTTRYRYLIDYAKKKMPNITFSSDIIVGFPGETEEEFESTLAMIKEMRYNALFTYMYSKRSHTKAADMLDPVPHTEKTKWIQKIIAVQQEICGDLNRELIGTVQTVLVENLSKDKKSLVGRTKNNVLVIFKGDISMISSFKDVRITDAMNTAIVGEIEKLS